MRSSMLPTMQDLRLWLTSGLKQKHLTAKFATLRKDRKENRPSLSLRTLRSSASFAVKIFLRMQEHEQMSEIDSIVEQLKCSFDGEAWHGPALMEILADGDADT